VRFFKLKGIELTIAFALVFSPFLASAGFLSAVATLFGSSGEEKSLISQGSYNMALLHAVNSIDPSTSGLSGEVSLVDDSALQIETSIAPGEEPFKASSDQISVYEVRKGDTLAEIAKMYGVTVNTIKWANDIKGNTVAPGEIITILPVSGIKYTIKSGDSTASIAKKFKVKADDIIQFNNISENEALIAGTTLIIPDAEPEATSKPAPVKKSFASKIVGGLLSIGDFVRPMKVGVKTQGIHGNNGIDIGASIGSEVYASAAGQVIVAKQGGYNGGYGSYVVIQHSNGVQTLYAHLSSVTASRGQSVSQGQLIGHSGNTGKSTGPHLHFEVRGASNPF
jgi:LysM repeat protein